MRGAVTALRLLVAALVAAATPAGAGAPSFEECASREDPLEQISCYAAVAKETSDLTACDHAAREGVRYQCYAIFAEHSGSAQVCRRIPEASPDHRSLIDVCLSDVAEKVGDPELCTDIATPGLRDSCYAGLAKKTKDSALCDRIEDSGLKSFCTGEPVYVD